MLLPTGLAALGVSNAARLTKIVDLSGAQQRVISPNLRLIVAGNPGESLRILDAETGQTVGQSASPFTGSAVYSVDGTFLAFSTERNIELWDSRQGSKLASLTTPTVLANAPYLVFSGDGRYLAARDATALYVWDIRTRPTIIVGLTGSADELFQGGLAFTRDGTRIASTAQDGTTIYVWPLARLNNVASRNPPSIVARLNGHTGSVTSLVFSPDGTLLASAGEDQTIRLWDWNKRAAIGTLQGHTGTVTSLAFSPDGTLLVSSGAERTVRVWGVRDKTALTTLATEFDILGGVAFSTDSRLLYVREGERIRVWGVYPDANMPSTCQVVARRDTNLRAGPGTAFARSGQLREGDRITADGQTVSAAGQSVWLRIGDRGWVQATQVTAPAECLNIPFIANP